MSTNRTRSWRRLTALRAARRRRTELPPNETAGQEAVEPLPPLEPPDDDREFVVTPRLPRWSLKTA
jgi:hypothetical protein